MEEISSFSWLSSLFHERFFMGFVCYADETGTHDATGIHPGSEVAAVVGYMSPRENWEEFSKQWISVLRDYGVPFFHMSDFVNERYGPKNKNWPYRDWNRSKRDNFILDLIKISSRQTLMGVGGLLSVKDYDRLVPDWLKKEVGHPYHFCFQLFFDTVLKVFKDSFNSLWFKSGEQVAFFFDQQQEFKAKALQVFDEIKEAKDVDDHLGSITFANKENFIPLQAADLLAFRMRKVLTRKLNGTLPAQAGSWDEALAQFQNLHMSYHDAESLEIVVADLTERRLQRTDHE